MKKPTPRTGPCLLESLDVRRLLAFVGGGISTVTGNEYQSVDAIVGIEDGYIAAGTFGHGSDFGRGFKPTPLGSTDLFIALNRASGTSYYTIGGGEDEDDGEIDTDDGRAQFAASPLRTSEDYFRGVSTAAREADEYITALKIGPDGKLYAVIVYRNQISLNTQNKRGYKLSANDEYDLYDSAIVRYSIGSKLAFESAFTITGPFNEIVNDIDFDSAGNLIVAGSFERQADFDPSEKKKIFDPLGRSDAFVAKYKPSGELVYMSQFGGDSARLNEPEAIYGIVVDANDNIYAGGVFAEKADFDPRPGKKNRHFVEAQDATDGFTLKLAGNGTLLWVRTQGGDEFDGIRDVALAPNGGVYSVGYFEDEADVDPTSGKQIFVARGEDDHRAYATDLFTNRFDANGNLIWVKQLAGDGYELIASITSDASGNYILSGSFFGTADFDPSRRQRNLTTPEADIDDINQRDREHNYSGFVAKYSANAKLIDVKQIDGIEEEDVLLNAASLDASGNLFVGGRFKVGFKVDSIIVQTADKPRKDKDLLEDAFSFVFDSSFDVIS